MKTFFLFKVLKILFRFQIKVVVESKQNRNLFGSLSVESAESGPGFANSWLRIDAEKQCGESGPKGFEKRYFAGYGPNILKCVT